MAEYFITIDFYCDQAISVSELKSDRELSMRLGLNPGAVHMFRSKKSWPSPGTMVRLAQMANMHPVAALSDLNIWRERDPEARKHFLTLRELVKEARTMGAELPKVIPALILTMTVLREIVLKGTITGFLALVLTGTLGNSSHGQEMNKSTSINGTVYIMENIR